MKVSGDNVQIPVQGGILERIQGEDPGRVCGSYNTDLRPNLRR